MSDPGVRVPTPRLVARFLFGPPPLFAEPLTRAKAAQSHMPGVVELICVSVSWDRQIYSVGMVQYKQRPKRRPTETFADRQERKALQKIEGRAATAEYERDRQVVLDRMAQLRKAREDRERQD
jgi:uncharacterized protein YaiL (DUF2058 family)